MDSHLSKGHINRMYLMVWQKAPWVMCVAFSTTLESAVFVSGVANLVAVEVGTNLEYR